MFFRWSGIFIGLLGSASGAWGGVDESGAVGEKTDGAEDTAPASAFWGDSLSGRVFYGHYLNATSVAFGKTEQSALTLHLREDLRNEAAWGFHADVLGSLFFRSPTISGRDPNDLDLEARFREGYLSFKPDGWDARLGMLITSWGKTDLLNPTDYLTAWDATYFVEDSELQQLGTESASVSFTPDSGNSPFQFTAVFQARYPQTKLLLPQGEVPSGVTVNLDPAKPDFFDGNEEVALKAAYLASEFDVSVSAFQGKNHSPQYVLRGTAAAPAITPVFTGRRALGADFSRTFETWILRGEGAYSWTTGPEKTEAEQGLFEPDHFDAVAGVERGFARDWRAILQLMWRYHPDYANPASYTDPNPVLQAARRAVGEVNALLQNYQRRSRTGATLFLGYAPEESKWTAEMNLIGNFAGGDFFVRPKFSYELAPSVKLVAGLNYFGGPEDETLGALDDYNQVFVELGASF